MMARRSIKFNNFSLPQLVSLLFSYIGRGGHLIKLKDG
jgi:hypothetical protein